MLKLLGSLCILAAGAAVRSIQIRSARRELSVLQGLIEVFETMENEIRLNLTPLPRLLQKVGDRRHPEIIQFFNRVEQAISSGKTLSASWNSAAGFLCISPEDRRITAEIGEKLCGDEEAACRGLQFAVQGLLRNLEKKKSQQPELEKRSTALCFSGAAMLIILLI
jgi:stage III sporulation protein AB